MCFRWSFCLFTGVTNKFYHSSDWRQLDKKSCLGRNISFWLIWNMPVFFGIAELAVAMPESFSSGPAVFGMTPSDCPIILEKGRLFFCCLYNYFWLQDGTASWFFVFYHHLLSSYKILLSEIWNKKFFLKYNCAEQKIKKNCSCG